MKAKSMLIGLLIVAHVAALVGFLFLADLTQLLMHGPRELHVTIFGWRQELIAIGVAAMVAALILNLWQRIYSAKAIIANTVVFSMVLFTGYFLVTSMFPTQLTSAQFVSTDKADQHVRRDDEVMVIELNGDARAYPHKWMRQPHVVEDTVGGEEVAMTFCALSHLGLAYSPYIAEEKVELKVFTQIQNNLVMFDAKSDEPIQQIWGSAESGRGAMKPYPTQVMSYKAFKSLYPQGKVFFNPEKGVRDKVVRMMLRTVTNWQHELDAPVFPTIDNPDPRLHPKEQVWGINLGGEQVAFTVDFLERNTVVNTTVGGNPIVVVYYPQYSTVAGFKRGSSTIAVGEIDAHGNTPAGKLERIPVASEVLWLIWANFYPETDLKA